MRLLSSTYDSPNRSVSEFQKRCYINALLYYIAQFEQQNTHKQYACKSINCLFRCRLCIIFLFKDDDSEPILGQWFEETLSPNESQVGESQVNSGPQDSEEGNDPKNGNSKSARHQSSSDNGMCYLPDKKEPDGVIMHLQYDIIIMRLCNRGLLYCCIYFYSKV